LVVFGLIFHPFLFAGIIFCFVFINNIHIFIKQNKQKRLPFRYIAY
jgi:hypothetical protein